jgi:rhodanese-related sulfurtransferase
MICRLLAGSALAVVLATIAGACGYDGPRMTVAQLEERLGSPSPGITVVDVRPRAAFLEGHVPGALSCPLEQLAACRSEIAQLGGEVAVICNCGKGALSAAKQLAEHGQTAILVEGGYQAWRAAGYPLVGGK